MKCARKEITDQGPSDQNKIRIDHFVSITQSIIKKKAPTEIKATVKEKDSFGVAHPTSALRDLSIIHISVLQL